MSFISKKSLFKRLRDHRGVALLIVITFLSIMSSIVVDMQERSVLDRQIALNAKDRLQGFYLAQSAVNFTKLLIVYNKKAKSQLEKAGVSSSTLNAFGYQPLYKNPMVYPLSSLTLRNLAALSGAAPPDDTAADGAQAPAPSDDSGQSDQMTSGIKMLDSDKLNSFLDFDGDFVNEISSEAGKYSLNAVSKLTATSSSATGSSATTSTAPTSYDLQKKLLLQILMRPAFSDFFDRQDREAEDLVHATADFVDTNTAVNQFDGVERGDESQIYRDVDYDVKDGKMLTVSELRLIEGMSDDIFAALQPYVTVYQSTDTINPCVAEDATAESIVDSLIVLYSATAACTPPIAADDEETLKPLRDAVLGACPSKSGMASALNVALGLKDSDTVAATAESGTAETQSTSSKVSGCQVQFENFLTENDDVLTIKGIGTVGDVMTTITIVLDSSGAKASDWKILYYKAE